MLSNCKATAKYRPLYEIIFSKLQAYNNCITNNNKEWEARHLRALKYIQDNLFPGGSGIDNGTNIRTDIIFSNKFQLDTSFHHMDENGMYDGWTTHSILVKPNLLNQISLHITGKDKNNIKDYLFELFFDILTIEFAEILKDENDPESFEYVAAPNSLFTPRSLTPLPYDEDYIFGWQNRREEGTFSKALREAILCASEDNLIRLARGFPQEVLAICRYRHEKGYWDKVKSNAKNLGLVPENWD